jgi:hypothetical protein
MKVKEMQWTEDFEQKLRTKLQEEYEQCDNMVVFASKCNKVLKKGLIDTNKSANTLIKWIKTELGIMEG